MRRLTMVVSLVLVAIGAVCAAPILAPYGTPLGEIDGIVAYSSGDKLWKLPKEGNAYQCVDLPKRFVQSKGVKWVALDGQSASSLFPMVRAGRVPGLVAYVNGKTVQRPRYKDIICFEGGTNGHMGMVYQEAGNEVRLIEQNWHAQKGLFLGLKVTMQGQFYVVASRTTRTARGEEVVWRVQGWVRVRSQPVVRTPLFTYVVLDRAVAKNGALRESAQSLCAELIARLPDEANFSIILVGTGSQQMAIEPVRRWRDRKEGGDNLLRDVFQRDVTPKGDVLDLTSGCDQLYQNLSKIVKDQTVRVVMLVASSEVTGEGNSYLKQIGQQKWGITVVAMTPQTDRAACAYVAQRSGGTFLDYEGDGANILARLR